MDERKIEACAKAGHEANRNYCISIGDTSQPSWDDAPDWQKTSARNGVEGALNGATPEQSHESWLKEKEATGWKYGPVKDPEKKEHPCFVPYAELPAEQRAKDDIYLDAVKQAATQWDIDNAPAIDKATTGAHVLTQSEVDDLVEKVNALDALLADAAAGMKAKNDLIQSLDAEIAGLKQTNRLLVAAADAAQGDLARHTATGAPSKLVDLPKLGDIPAHKSLEEIHGTNVTSATGGPVEV